MKAVDDAIQAIVALFGVLVTYPTLSTARSRTQTGKHAP
jgi:hypothetical protein